MSLKHIFDQCAAIPKDIKYGAGGSKPVSLHTCVRLFDDFVKTPGFDYYRDGCYARAHLMCRALEKMDIAPAKVWAFKNIEFANGWRCEETLSLQVNDQLTLNWDYHVAVCLPVRMPDKSIQNIVLDPTVMNGPTTVQQWCDVLHALDKNVDVVPFRTPSIHYNSDYTPVEETTAHTDIDAQSVVTDFARYRLSEKLVKKESDIMRGYKPPRRQSMR